MRIRIPTFRLSTIFLIVVIVALTLVVIQQNRRLLQARLLAPQDVLALNVPGIFPRFPEDVREVNLMDIDGNRTVSGYVTSIDRDGKITIPSLPTFDVNGLSVDQFRENIVDACRAIGRPINADDIQIAIIEKRVSTLLVNDAGTE